MVETITPVVHGGRRGRWAITAALHVLGAALSAAFLGLLLGSVGHLLGDPWRDPGALVATGVAFLYAGRELFGLPIPVPDRRTQVPEWWRSSLPSALASFLYGAILGTGFLTHLRHGTVVAVAALALGSADPVVAAAMMVPFGLVRGLSVVVAAAAGASSGGTPVIARLESIGSSAATRAANGSVLLVVAVVSFSLIRDPAASIAALSAALIAAVFAWSGVAKLVRFARWRRSLEVYRFPRSISMMVTVLVPTAELAVPVLLVAGRTPVASTAALVLLAAFSVAVLRARVIAGNRLPCGCFGGEERRDYRLLLGRNLALAGAAAVAIVRSTPVFPAPRLPDPSEILPTVLIVAGLICVAWTGRRLMALRRLSSSS